MLLLQHQIMKYHKNSNNNKKIELCIIEQNMYVNFIFLVMSLLCFIYHLVVVPTTQFHSNMCLIDHFVVFATAQLHTNNNNKLHVHILLNFQ